MEKQSKEETCPICASEMKVNMDFQIAKCQNNSCGFVINWSSLEHMFYTTFRLAVRLMKR